MDEINRKVSKQRIEALELREQVRDDGLEFWAERQGWPISLDGKRFLLDAIDLEGKRLFGTEWTGLEQAEQFLPILLDGGDVAAGGLDEIYAINLLGQYRPEMRRAPVLAQGDEIYTNPLTEAEWRAAFDIFRAVVAPGLAAGRRRLVTVIEGFISRLLKGDLRAYARSIRGIGDISPISPESWTVDVVRDRFLFGLLYRHDELKRPLWSPKRIKASLLSDTEWPEFIFLAVDERASTIVQRAPKLQTRHELEEQEAKAREIYFVMKADSERVKQRPYEERCRAAGIKTTISRIIFKELNQARPGQR